MNRQANPGQDSRFQSLLARGLSREKAQRIVNAEADGSSVVSEPETYADWTDEELYARAEELGVEDRAGMSREELIAAIHSS
jgi:hypothetical protein